MGSPLEYNDIQQFFSLSVASNALSKARGTSKDLQQRLTTALNDGLPLLNSDWQIVWGPAVYKPLPLNPLTGPTNAWYVAWSPSRQTYVVAIAGTASRSFQAIMQDVDIEYVVDFDAWTSSWSAQNIPTPVYQRGQPGPQPPAPVARSMISRGTARFTQNVLNTPSPINGAAPGLKLGQFLQQVALRGTIIFTGHSMGGAVAPTVALGLVQTKILNASNVIVLPSAGATPGNMAFADAYASTFPPRGIFNSDYFNNLDIVPQAFCMDVTVDRHFSNILALYETATGPAAEFVHKWYDFVLNKINQTMPYANLPGAAFTGPNILPIDNKDDLVTCLGNQHMSAYWTALGIQQFVSDYENIMKQTGLEDVNDEDALETIELEGLVPQDSKVPEVATQEVPVDEVNV